MFLYKRELLGEKVEKVLLAYNGSILLNPVEPLNMPREITSYLLLEFGKVLMVEPLAKKKVFIKFPIEIGVFVTGKEIFDVLDVFSVVKSKFSLYGNPSSGVVCKYHKSEVYPLLPSVDTLREGVMELTITNTTNKWVEVTKAVFNAYGMKIYYNDRLVSMKSNMKVLSTKVAETDFVDSPLEKGMIKSLELYTARKLSITTPKFIMEGEI